MSGNLTPEEAQLAKGMRKRGDWNQDIAAWLATNQGRPSEINTGQEHPDVPAAPINKLPPKGAPVKHLLNLMYSVERALQALEGSDVEAAKRELSGSLSNIAVGTSFFQDRKPLV